MSAAHASTPGLRGWMDRHPAAAAGIAVALLIVSITTIALAVKGPSRQPRDRYLLNLETGEVYPGAAGDLDAIIAHVFSCGQCADESSRFVGYITRHNPETIARVREQYKDADERKFRMMLDLSANHTQYLPPDGQLPWLDTGSRQATQLITAARQRCGGQTPTPCMP